MKWILSGGVVLATRLAFASVVMAQIVDPEPRPVRPRVEIGMSTGATVFLPEYGAVLSAPLGPRTAIELVVARMPAFWDAPPHTIAQAQVRMPFREHLRSRKSLTLGVTRIVADDRRRFFGSDGWAFVRPHAGVSLQWPAGPGFDIRFDAQGLFTLDSELPLVPRAVAAFVWHPHDGR